MAIMASSLEASDTSSLFDESSEEEMAARVVVAACGDSLVSGITILDVETGEILLQIPASASPLQGLLFVKNNPLLIASQLQINHDSLATGGAIFFWTLDKPLSRYKSYMEEAIEPIACAKDGIHLAGGSPSGNAHVWEVPSGRLLKSWHAHQTSIKCLAFSEDNSFLISGSEDGTISVWHMISLLDVADPQACRSLRSFLTWSEHASSITGLLPFSAGPNSWLISSSLDITCKVWDLISGRLLQTYVFLVAVTAATIDVGKQLFAGCIDGKIYINSLDVHVQKKLIESSDNETEVLCGHRGPITALAFNSEGLWLVSASEDCTVCLWDANNWQAIRRFNFGKGHITNLVLIPRPSLSVIQNQKSSLCPRVSILEKASQTNLLAEGTLILLPQYCSRENYLISTSLRISTLMHKQILDLEQGRAPEAIQMMLETSAENRSSTMAMTKHVININKNLQIFLLDMTQQRLCLSSSAARTNGRKVSSVDQ